MPTCLIALGANLGDRRQTLQDAVRRLEQQPRIRLLKTSQWRPSAAVGGPAGQPSYLNGALTLETSLSPEDVLTMLQQVEHALGRERGEPWGPRSIDLDLLLYDQERRWTPTLTLPHPRMAWRRFVLEPAAEVAGAMLHPTTGWTVARLLNHLNTAPPYIALAGGIGAGKTSLAHALAQTCCCDRIVERLNSRLLRRFYADPSGNAWRMELEFLRSRTQLLAANNPDWLQGRLRVSDFWFDQSRAFAQVWLAMDQRKVFFAACERARRRVARPKLIVWLDVPARQLHERTQRRGRPYERRLGRSLLEHTAEAIRDELAKPDVGPVLRLGEGSRESMLAEVLAAAESMQ